MSCCGLMTSSLYDNASGTPTSNERMRYLVFHHRGAVVFLLDSSVKRMLGKIRF